MLGDHLINFEGIFGAMAEQADAVDSKSTAGDSVRVQISLARPRPQHVGKLLNFCMPR